MHDNRSLHQPPTPATTDAIELEGKFTKTLEGSRDFLLFDTQDSDRIICFSSEIQREVLSSVSEWHVDGTFYTSPHGYTQTLSIHGFFRDEMYFCGNLTLKSKKFETYKRALSEFKRNSPNLVDPVVCLVLLRLFWHLSRFISISIITAFVVVDSHRRWLETLRRRSSTQWKKCFRIRDILAATSTSHKVCGAKSAKKVNNRYFSSILCSFVVSLIGIGVN